MRESETIGQYLAQHDSEKPRPKFEMQDMNSWNRIHGDDRGFAQGQIG